ncbi:MAG: NnrU family protein [Salibaculum sp.]|uniref:NnrU family protein n=1 Tax=Salibaculum sp. TaxID=2855480 RepID=UPI0028702015|nr:NnrU family protein [Salibaculum sp.]MDR9427621.1 NnrU family protein [Salibaculum sp.]MDR9482129.1 NnrU family protein [Salibaculum sp.]
MTLLILGILLWVGAHLFKRLAPEPRARMGDKGKGLLALVLVVSLVLMVIGYRGAAFVNIWYPPSFMVHINNLLMLIAFFVFGLSATTGSLRGRLRHPQLLAVKIWAVAHLLVNGDLASIVLFGSMLLWAGAEVAVINRAEAWDRPAPGDPKRNVLLVVITVVAFTVTAAIHAWLGVWPFSR